VGYLRKSPGLRFESGISVDESSFSLGSTFDLRWASSFELLFYPFHSQPNEADAACPKRPSLQGGQQPVANSTVQLIPTEMVIGAQRVPPKAHAWGEVEGRVVDDRPEAKANYLVINRC
jgi:hypothetical protein